VLGVEEGVDYAAFSGGCKTMRQQTAEEVSSGEGEVMKRRCHMPNRTFFMIHKL